MGFLLVDERVNRLWKNKVFYTKIKIGRTVGRGESMQNSGLQVKDVLHQKHFEKAELIAGETGLHKLIKWVHVLEVMNAKHLLEGKELILTTGVTFQHNKEKFVQFIKEIIEADCAGVCIEYGEYVQSVPSDVIDIANQFDFPIIVFNEQVRFVDITQNLHTLIINHQYTNMAKLESYSQMLNQETLHTQNIERILKLLYDNLKLQLIYEVEGHDPIFYPNMPMSDRERILIKRTDEKTTSHFYTQPIYLFEHIYGNISIYSENHNITDFELLMLDRTVTALAQLLLRKLYVEERKGIEDALWLEGWLEGQHSDEEIRKFLNRNLSIQKKLEGTILIISLPHNEQNKQLDGTYFKLFCQAIFDKNGFLPFILEKKNEFILVLMNRFDISSIKRRLKEGIEKVAQSNLLLNPEFAVGKVVKDFRKIKESYQTALDHLYICRNLQTKSYFYDELYMFHLIYKMQKQTNLNEMVEDYLQPLIDFDDKYNGQLLETLEVYLKMNGSKQETAKQLFIVRQTLYHRLRKIESLIGRDFMQGENRLALEFMILARKFSNQVKLN